MRDPYEVLGVAKSANDTEIKRVYRKLAKNLHPDLNPGNPEVENRFKEVSAAYKIVGDKDLRAKYDRGEIGADGSVYQGFPGAGPGGRRPPGGGFAGFQGGGFKAEDLFGDFGDFFENLRGGGARRGQRPAAKRKGRDRNYTIEVDFLDAALGTKRRISLPSGKTLDVAIPAGIEDGKQIRLKGQGDAGSGGGPAGDGMIEVSVRPHPHFERDGLDIVLNLPISLKEAVLGARVEVPTITGSVTMKIPTNATSGHRMRLKGKGIKRIKPQDAGNQYVTLQVMLPEDPDEELEEFIRNWSKGADDDPRRKAGLV